MSQPFAYVFNETLLVVRRRLKEEALDLLETVPIPEDLREDLTFEVLIFRSDLPQGGDSPPLPRVLGTFQPAPHRIGISHALVLGDREALLQEVLRHELAHLCAWVVENADGHGAAFHRWCDLFRIPRRARCPVDEVGEAQTQEQQRLALRVRKLFALAESPHREEATEALRKANELIQRYNLSLIPETGEAGAEEDLIGVELWRGGNTPIEVKLISGILGDFFGVYPLLERENGATVLMGYGSVATTEVASYVFAYLLRVSSELWSQYRRERGPSRKKRERISFFIGLFQGFRTTLNTVTSSESPAPTTSAATTPAATASAATASTAEVAVAQRQALSTRVRELVWDNSGGFRRRGGISYNRGEAYEAGEDMGSIMDLRPGLRGAKRHTPPPRLLP